MPIFTYQMVGMLEDSKAHIINTALQLFLEKSFKAVTFQELMEKTGFSKGAFFYYFKNKQEIFEAVTDHYINQFSTVDFSKLSQTSLREFLDGYFPEVRKMRTASGTLPAAISANQYALIFEAQRVIPNFKDKINKHEEKVLAGWLNIITAALKSKEIKPTLSDIQLTRLFIDAGHGVVLNAIMNETVGLLESEIQATWNGIYELVKN